MGDLEHEKGTKEAIAELKSLIHGHRMGRNSPGKSKIPGPLAGRITKTMIYGKERKSELDLGIREIKKALSDFAKQVRKQNQEKEKRYEERYKFKKSEEVENAVK